MKNIQKTLKRATTEPSAKFLAIKDKVFNIDKPLVRLWRGGQDSSGRQLVYLKLQNNERTEK